jgi:hypothetical protein
VVLPAPELISNWSSSWPTGFWPDRRVVLACPCMVTPPRAHASLHSSMWRSRAPSFGLSLTRSLSISSVRSPWAGPSLDCRCYQGRCAHSYFPCRATSQCPFPGRPACRRTAALAALASTPAPSPWQSQSVSSEPPPPFPQLGTTKAAAVYTSAPASSSSMTDAPRMGRRLPEQPGLGGPSLSSPPTSAASPPAHVAKPTRAVSGQAELSHECAWVPRCSLAFQPSPASLLRLTSAGSGDLSSVIPVEDLESEFEKMKGPKCNVIDSYE